VDRGVASPAEERLAVRVDRVDGPGESEAIQALDDHPAWRGTIRCAEHGDRTGPEKRREIDHAPVPRFLTAGAPLSPASSARVSGETTRAWRANPRFGRSTTSLRVCRMVRGASYRMAPVTRYWSLVNAGHPAFVFRYTWHMRTLHDQRR